MIERLLMDSRKGAEPLKQIVAFFWYRTAEEFEYLKSVSEDSATHFDTYAQWLKAAENGITQLSIRGEATEVFKAEVDPEKYLAWCRSGGHKINSKSRTAYANVLCASKYGLGGH
jgi:hypothetical protein